MPTPNYSLPLPDPDNNARTDAQSLADALTQIDGILSGKADSGHGHAIADVAGLQTALDGKSPVGHGHIISDVGGLQSELDNRALVGHGHLIADVTDLQAMLDGKSPVGHGHAIADVINLQTELDNRSLVGHGHAIADVSGLQTALDGKLNDAAGVITEAHLGTGVVTESKTGPNVWTQGRFASLIGSLAENTNVAGSESVACDDGKRVTLQAIADLGGPDFVSGNTFFPSGSKVLTVAHGLGSTPSNVALVANCEAANENYSVGDKVFVNIIDKAGEYATLFADSTNVGIVIYASYVFMLNDKTGDATYAWVGPGNTNWSYTFLAWR